MKIGMLIVVMLIFTSCFDNGPSVRHSGVVIAVYPSTFSNPARMVIQSGTDRFNEYGEDTFVVGDSVSFVHYPEMGGSFISQVTLIERNTK